MADTTTQIVDNEWVTFPGGELEGERPRTLCPACRERLRRATGRVQVRRPASLCFQCYRADLDRQKALRAAGQLQTTSDERFQFVLPLELVNRPRLEMLKAERIATRSPRHGGSTDIDRCAGRRRQAQIAARHALQSIGAGLRMRKVDPAERERVTAAAIHAAELQLPESWLPFVISR